MINKVVFDVGRVLLQFDPDTMMRKLGYSSAVVEAVNRAMFRHALWNEFDRGVIGDEQLLESFVSHDLAVAGQIRESFQTIPSAMFPFDYADEWIEELKNRGYEVYILSNYARKTFDETKDRMTFLEKVDGAVFSYQCGHIKPEPEIYRHLLEKYRLAPETCVFIDDRSENVEAARKQGMAGIRFESYSQAREELNTLLAKQ